MNSRLEFLTRRNKGKQLMGNYISNLSKATGLSEDVLLANNVNLELSDDLYNNFIDNIRSINSGIYEKPFIVLKIFENENIIEKLTSLGVGINGCEYFFLMDSTSHYCGAFKIKLGTISDRFKEIADCDGDFFGLISADLLTGIMIDVTSNQKNDYELICYYQCP